MTNQNNNVVRPEVNSCINTLISGPESMAVLGEFLGFSHSNFIKRLDLEGANVNAWIDLMRAASPTRSENQEKSSWIVSIFTKKPFHGIILRCFSSLCSCF